MAKDKKSEEVIPAEDVKRPYRDVMADRFREEYPDEEMDYADDDAFFSTLEKYNSGRDALMNTYKENGARLAEVFTESPQAAIFFTSLMSGSDVLEALGEGFGEDIVGAMEDPELRKSYQAGVEKWKANKSASDEIIKQQEENSAKYADEVESFFAEQGMDEEEKGKFSQFVADFIDKLVRFELAKDVLTQLYRAYKYDSDIAEATEVGEVRGRNEKIMLERNKGNNSDGLPMTNMSGRDNPDNRSYSGRKSIWDR